MTATDYPITKELKEEHECRFKEAKAQKDFVRPDIEECYFFAAPDRYRSARTSSAQKPIPPQDDVDRYTSLGEEMAEDFAEVLYNAFFVDDWAKLKAGTTIPEDSKAQVEELIAANTEKTLQAVKGSSFEAAFMQASVPDAGHGTVAVLIEDLRTDEPAAAQAIPAAELEINLGPDGRVDDRFINRWYANRHVKAVLPVGIELPEKVEKELTNKPKGRTEIKWGWWRDWSDRGNIAWIYTIAVGTEIVHAKRLVGAGSCQLLVWRINPDPRFAWGRGPTRQTLPELRMLDELNALELESVDQKIHPSWTYPNDGTLNFEGGLIAGMGYPCERGSSQDIKSLFFEGDIEFSWLEEDKITRRIRRAHYADRPEQEGKTPPSASQWVDEVVRAQRQLGVPGASFWRECPLEVFQRFHYILKERGIVPKIEANGNAIAVAPYNPTERAKDLQEIQNAERLGMLGQSLMPQTFQLMVNGPETLKALQTKIGDKLLKFVEPEQAQQLLQAFASQMTGGQPASPPQ